MNREPKRERDGKFAPDSRGKKAPSTQAGTSLEVNGTDTATATRPTVQLTHAAYRKNRPLIHRSGIECHACGKEYPSREWDGHYLPDEEGESQDYCDQCVSDHYDEKVGFFPSV